MTHDSKEKFWLFYLNDPKKDYPLYAFTNDSALAKNFKMSRCMDHFYEKKASLDRTDYSNLIKKHMRAELQLFEGHVKTGKSQRSSSWSLALTKQEVLHIMQNTSLYLHEKLYQLVWSDPYLFKRKYLKALDKLGYVALHEYINSGDNSYTRQFEERILSNDLEFLLEEYGWTFIEEVKE